MTDRIYNKPVAFSSLLENPDSMPGKLFLHAGYLSQLEKKLHLFLESPLNTHCKIANFSNETLVLHSDSAAWAAKLRYNIPAILNYMQTECRLTTLKTVRIRIKLPEQSSQAKSASKNNLISRDSANYLNQMADSMSDADLRLSLLKLSRHGRSDA